MHLCPMKPYLLEILITLGAVDPCAPIWLLNGVHPEETDQWLTVWEILESPLFERRIGSMSWTCLYNNLKNYRRQNLVKRDGEGYRYDPYRFQVTKVGVDRLLYFESESTDEDISDRREYLEYMKTERSGSSDYL